MRISLTYLVIIGRVSRWFLKELDEEYRGQEHPSDDGCNQRCACGLLPDKQNGIGTKVPDAVRCEARSTVLLSG